MGYPGQIFRNFSGQIFWNLYVYSRGIALALVGTVVPVLLAGAAMRRIGGGPTAVIGTIGPGVTVLLAWAWLGEAPTVWTWLGLALTVAGGLAVSLWARPRASARA